MTGVNIRRELLFNSRGYDPRAGGNVSKKS